MCNAVVVLGYSYTSMGLFHRMIRATQIPVRLSHNSPRRRYNRKLDHPFFSFHPQVKNAFLYEKPFFAILRLHASADHGCCPLPEYFLVFLSELVSFDVLVIDVPGLVALLSRVADPTTVR